MKTFDLEKCISCSPLDLYHVSAKNISISILAFGGAEGRISPVNFKTA